MCQKEGLPRTILKNRFETAPLISGLRAYYVDLRRAVSISNKGLLEKYVAANQ